jgi:hypothetical protein
MKMSSSAIARAALAAALIHTIGAVAQDTTPAASGALPPSGKQRDAIFAAFVQDKLSELLSGKSGELRLKYIEPDTAGAEAGWGIDYEWHLSRSAKPSRVPEKGSSEPFILGRMSSELDIKGTYAFGDVPNNQNQSTITAALKLERGNFGKLNVLDKAISDAFQMCLLAIPVPEKPEDIPEYNRASSECTQSNGIDKMIRATPDAYYYWVDFHGGVEANQDYSDSRTLFGLAGAYVRQPSVARASTNIFDAPFRFMRDKFSAGASDQNLPYVAPYPSLLLGIERLDAKDDDTRTALTTKTNYTRAKAEVAFNTVVANIDQQLVRFNISYRYFHELSAPDAIQAAGLDSFDFVSASLRFPAQLLPIFPSDDYELFVSFTNGQLPFNTTSDRAIEVGFATNIQALADFLAQ